MIKIGITGGIASGKSLLEGFLQKLQIPVIDADKIVHDLYTEKDFKEKIINIFQKEDIFEDGELSRKKIGEIVFRDKNKLKSLEELLHPEVINKIKTFFDENKNEEFAAASVPLLFEAKMEGLFDCIITIFTDEENQLKRLIQRNNLTEEEAITRINAQMNLNEKIKKSHFTINNSGNPDETEKQLIEILKLIREKYDKI